VSAIEFVDINAGGRALVLEYQFVGVTDPSAPLVVFLHEGLGSRSMWRDYPDAFCKQGSYRGLVYSRPAYGKSTPRPQGVKWDDDFMHIEARSVLPAFLDALRITEKVFLFGHSDGGSISLLFASFYPERVKGVIVAAPHLFVEDLTINSIVEAKEIYRTTDMRDRLARYHDDVDSAFWGWNDIWLTPHFREWNIEADVKNIRAPVLAVQGVDDQYGTLAQIDTLARIVPGTRLLKIENCKHSAHRDQPEILTKAGIVFIEDNR
jgi:pimeloyl-ACP methyl ester carboxylesterase